jgi:hypothetical protein
MEAVMRMQRYKAQAQMVAGLAVLAVLAGCGEAALAPDPAVSARRGAPAAAAPSIVLDQGTLHIRGDHGDNAIRIQYTREGVQVWLDGVETWIRDAVVAIEVDAGHGDNDVAYHQRAAADVELQIETGAGDDRVRVALEPAPGPDALSRPFTAVGVRVDAGAGSDHVDIRWNGTALPASNYYVKLEVDRDPFVPEVGDEVVVSFQHGEPDRPVIVGAVWNGRGSGSESGEGQTDDARNLLSLAAELAADGSRIDLGIDGGAALEERVRVHANLQGGHHHVGTYIVTSARHAQVESTIVGDDGDHGLDLTFARRNGPARGEVVDGTSNTVLVSETRLGDGDNDVRIRAVGYDHVRNDVVHLGAGDNHLDVRIEVPTLEARSSKPKEIVVVGSKVRAASLDVMRRRGRGFGPTAVRLHDVVVAGELAVSVDPGEGGGPMSYNQDRIATEGYLAQVDVRLLGGPGGDHLTAILDGITGDGAFQLRAHGAAGNDRIHVRADRLRPGRYGQLWLEVLGGEGNDVLSLMLPADLDDAAAVAGRIDGGGGRNICRATGAVQVVGCQEAPTGS